MLASYRGVRAYERTDVRENPDPSAHDWNLKALDNPKNTPPVLDEFRADGRTPYVRTPVRVRVRPYPVSRRPGLPGTACLGHPRFGTRTRKSHDRLEIEP